MKASILAILLSQALVAFSLPTQSQHISERSATSPPNPIVWPESAIGYDAIANKFIYKEHENVTTVMYSPANHSNLERRQKFIAAKVKVCKNSGFREPCKIEVLPVHDDVQFRICLRIDPHKVWNNVISSIEVAKEYYCILFNGDMCDGRQLRVTRVDNLLDVGFNDMASSIACWYQYAT